jgi:hypothetical protein
MLDKLNVERGNRERKHSYSGHNENFPLSVLNVDSSETRWKGAGGRGDFSRHFAGWWSFEKEKKPGCGEDTERMQARFYSLYIPQGDFSQGYNFPLPPPTFNPSPLPIPIFNLCTICTYRYGCLCSGTVPGTVPYYISVVDPEWFNQKRIRSCLFRTGSRSGPKTRPRKRANFKCT